MPYITANSPEPIASNAATIPETVTFSTASVPERIAARGDNARDHSTTRLDVASRDGSSRAPRRGRVVLDGRACSHPTRPCGDSEASIGGMIRRSSASHPRRPHPRACSPAGSPASKRFFPPQKLPVANDALAEPTFFFGLLAVDVLDTERRRYRHHAQSRHRDARLAHARTPRSEMTGEGRRGTADDVVASFWYWHTIWRQRTKINKRLFPWTIQKKCSKMSGSES